MTQKEKDKRGEGEKRDEDERRKRREGKEERRGGESKKKRSTALKSPICPWASSQPITKQQPILPPSLANSSANQLLRCITHTHVCSNYKE